MNAITTRTLDVFDPPMCCSTGVCGPEVDADLVRFAADLEWLKSRGVTVRRFNLSNEPEAFMKEPEVIKAVSYEGTRSLPVVVVDGKIVSRRVYPTRDELAAMAGLSRPGTLSIVGPSAPATLGTGCCGSNDTGKSGCCT